MKGRSKSCYVLAAAGKEESILLLRQILRGVSGAGQLRVQQVVTLDEIRRGVSGAGAQAPADLLIAVMPLSDGTGIEGIIRDYSYYCSTIVSLSSLRIHDMR